MRPQSELREVRPYAGVDDIQDALSDLKLEFGDAVEVLAGHGEVEVAGGVPSTRDGIPQREIPCVLAVVEDLVRREHRQNRRVRHGRERRVRVAQLEHMSIALMTEGVADALLLHEPADEVEG